jgi:hypothetical protein
LFRKLPDAAIKKESMKNRKSIFIVAVLGCILFLPACKEKTACPNCSLIPESGICNAAIPRYYYDQEEHKCKEFIWGGCGGVVPFETMEECEACSCDE